MNIKKTSYEVSGQQGTLELMKDLCLKYKSDCDNMLFHSEKDFKFVYNHLRSMYRLEKGEQLQRPRVTEQLKRCDCDCQTIYLTCCALNNPDVLKIIWIVCGSTGYTHIFPIIVFRDNNAFFKTAVYYFDMLPERHFNEKYFYKYFKYFMFEDI